MWSVVVFAWLWLCNNKTHPHPNAVHLSRLRASLLATWMHRTHFVNQFVPPITVIRTDRYNVHFIGSAGLNWTWAMPPREEEKNSCLLKHIVHPFFSSFVLRYRNRKCDINAAWCSHLFPLCVCGRVRTCKWGPRVVLLFRCSTREIWLDWILRMIFSQMWVVNVKADAGFR